MFAAGIVPFIRGTIFTAKTAKVVAESLAVGTAITAGFQAIGDSLDQRAVRAVNESRREFYESVKDAGIYTDEELERLAGLLGEEVPSRTTEQFIKELPVRTTRRVYRAAVSTIGADYLVTTAPLWAGSTVVRTLAAVVVGIPTYGITKLVSKDSKAAGEAFDFVMTPFDVANRFIWKNTFLTGLAVMDYGDRFPVAPPPRLDKVVTFDSQEEKAPTTGDNNVAIIAQAHKVVMKDMGTDYQSSPEMYGRRLANRMLVDEAFVGKTREQLQDFRMAYQIHLAVIQMPLPNQVIAIDAWDKTIAKKVKAADDGLVPA